MYEPVNRLAIMLRFLCDASSNRILQPLTLLLLLLPLGCAVAQQQPTAQTPYGYFYKGELITLTPSERLVAASDSARRFGNYLSGQGFERDPLSDHAALREHGLILFRQPESAATPNLRSEMAGFAGSANEQVQPVFEQGQGLLIPTNEIIVRFDAPTTLMEAQAFFAPHQDAQGIVNIGEHRANGFILQINDASNGRVYQVSQFLAGLEGLEFVEPNHIVLFFDTPQMPAFPSQAQGPVARMPGMNSSLSVSHNSPVGWTELVNEDCEGATLPAGWTTGRLNNTFADAQWNVTTVQSHSGNGSCYATGAGTGGTAAPGPYPDNAYSWLDTPLLNLASYEEIYIELWFYAKYQPVVPCNVPDLGAVGISDPTASTTSWVGFLAVCYTGDLTADPTTDNGWRRALYRVPPNLRLDGVNVRFVFVSDDSTADEGLYIDQIRVVATTDVDTEPVGNDTFGARHYEMRNSGQIAGLGNDNNDMKLPEAWGPVSVSNDVVVAVIDSGVDLTHPDLNLVTGYDPDGSVGGGVRGSHGTAVAGNVGAIGDNSVGVLGTAPGVQIMPVYMGSTYVEIANAIDIAVARGANVLSNSWGWLGAPSSVIESAITDALNANRVVLFAAGNGPDRPPWTYDVAFPGNLCGSTDVICVGASSPTDEHKAAASSDGAFWWGSSYVGDGPDIVAPSPWSYTTDIQGSAGYNDGSDIDPTDPASADYTCCFGGTSSATPKVAGIVALMLSANPNLTPAEVKQILRETAHDIDAPGFDDKTGAGRVNAYGAVVRALGTDGWTDDGAVVRLITNTDSVGIGTTTPVDKLEVEGGQFTVDGAGGLGAIRFRQNDTMKWTFLTAPWIGGDDFRLRNEATGRDVMAFDSETNFVGIGTTSPGRKLSIEHPSHQIRLTGQGPNGIELMDNDGTAGLNILYRTAPDELRIEKGSGDILFSVNRDTNNVNIGNQSLIKFNLTNLHNTHPPLAGSDFGIAWNQSGGRGETVFYQHGGAGWRSGYDFWTERDGVGKRLQARIEDTGHMRIRGSYKSLSDAREKTNIQEITNALYKIQGLRGVYFDWVSDESRDGERQIGLVAQEVMKFVPEVVSTYNEAEEGETAGADESLYDLHYDGLIPILIEAIQEQQQMIDAMSERIATLESGGVVN